MTIHRRTRGNPLYVTEVARLLQPDDLVTPANRPLLIPDELTRVVERNLSQHSAGCQRLLDGASVAGVEFELEMLQAEPEAVAEALVVGVLAEDSATPSLLRRSHALVREVQYNQVSRADRIAWHRRIAERLEHRGDQYAGALAWHRLRSAVDVPSHRQAVAACSRAAEVATAGFDFRRAAERLARSLPLLDDQAARAETQVSIARAGLSRRTGERDSGGLQSCLAGRRTARSCRPVGRGGGVLPHAEYFAGQSAAYLGAIPRVLGTLAHARSLLARGLPGDRARAVALLETCLAIARRLDIRPTIAAAAALGAEASGLSSVSGR